MEIVFWLKLEKMKLLKLEKVDNSFDFLGKKASFLIRARRYVGRTLDRALFSTTLRNTVVRVLDNTASEYTRYIIYIYRKQIDKITH